MGLAARRAVGYSAPAPSVARPSAVKTEGPQPTVRCPERFAVDKDACSISRTVTRSDGTNYSCTLRLANAVGKNNSTQTELAAYFYRSYLRLSVWPQIEPSTTIIRAVDLYSGCGGMSAGVWEACRAIGRHLKPVLAIDNNVHAVNTYRLNFPSTKLRSRSITDYLNSPLGEPASSIEKQIIQDAGQIDLLIGGPPCQGNSDLNNRTRRSDPKNRLYDRMARFAELVRPTHIIIENVPAVLHDEGRVVDRTAEHLTKTGYTVDHAAVEISDLGIAQRRRRHVLVASLERKPDIGRWTSLYKRDPLAVSWAIGDLRRKPFDSTLNSVTKPTSTTKQRIEFLFEHDLYDLPDEQRPDCHRLNNHSYKSVYGRLAWDEPAQTITSGFTCMGQGRFVHPKEKRTITPHEAARLQFIPDFFQFDDKSPRTRLAEMIGNVVPPKLTYVLALELLR